MSKNFSGFSEAKASWIPSVIYALISNALQVYGILVLGWHFFPILYLWWWEELVLTVFGVFKLRRLRPILLENEPETEVQAGESAVRVRFFLLFVYFVFVVVMGAFVFAPKGSYVENILTLMFKNSVFNLNLLIFIGMQGWVFWSDFYPNPRSHRGEWSILRNTFNVRSAVIHVGLLAGALLAFLIQRYQFAHAEHAFMFGFMALKTVVEIGGAVKFNSPQPPK